MLGVCETHACSAQDVGQGLPEKYSLKLGMQLYSLDQYHVLWEKSNDTKVRISGIQSCAALP